VAQLPYCFAHSYGQRGDGLDAFQAAVWELSIFFAGDFREEKFRVTKNAGQGIV
jgi:hypothetical protein